MKRILSILLSLLALAGCARHKIIPDEKLAMIFRDAFLANAYLTDRQIRADSVRVYEPIFERYGYTTEDVQYTIGNFSKRKSARLGDVVEQAIVMLETEGNYLNGEVAVLDTINHVARRTFTRTVLRDTLIEARTLKDTLRLRRTLDSLRPGEYRIHLDYLIDSLDGNKNLRGSVWLERADSSRTDNYTFVLRREREEHFERTLEADSSARRLVVDLWQPRGKPTRPRITLRNLEIRFTPPTAEAVDSLYEQQLDLRIFAGEFLHAVAPDSLALDAR